jgi:hypothetical protein
MSANDGYATAWRLLERDDNDEPERVFVRRPVKGGPWEIMERNSWRAVRAHERVVLPQRFDQPSGEWFL